LYRFATVKMLTILNLLLKKYRSIQVKIKKGYRSAEEKSIAGFGGSAKTSSHIGYDL
jgi:hypothetical protein